ncbi:transposase (fragment) [Thiomonas sp. X19]
MFVKITSSGGRREGQRVAARRDAAGRVKPQRTVATLGRADQAGGQLDGVMRGRRRLRGQTPVDEAQAAAGPALQNGAFAPSRNLGDVCERWPSFGRNGDSASSGVCAVARAAASMKLNRRCDPTSKRVALHS